MRSDDPKSHVAWCLKQKRGIKCEDPNDTLCDVYLKKAASALNILSSATEKDEIMKHLTKEERKRRRLPPPTAARTQNARPQH